MREPTRRLRVLSRLFGLGCVVALGVVPSAQAANIVPNPGFELNCSGIPCNWSAVPNTAVTIAYDTVNPHPPSTASMKVTAAQSTTAGAISDCVPFALAAGSTYAESFWYRTTATLTHVPSLAVFEYTNNNCTGSEFTPGNVLASSTVSDGAWHAVSGTVTMPTAGQSIRFVPFFACACSQATTATVNFDDIVFESSPLAVTVSTLRATRSHQNVVLRWRTGTEADTLGFHVYRSRGQSWKRLTRSLVAAKGSVAGASYRFVDRTARRGVSYRYRIKAIDRDGVATWFGPVRVT
jgi:hypothetical protein